MPRKATIGPEIYERVNALVGEGKSRTEAFAQVAEERGSRPGSVAANYYRVARGQGGTTRRRRATTRRPARRTAAAAPARQRRTTARATSASAPSGDVGQIAQQIADLTQQLVRQVQARDEKLRQLLG